MPNFNSKDYDNLFNEDFDSSDKKEPNSKPKKPKKEDNKKGCLVGCGAVVLIFFLFILFTTMIGSGEKNSNNKSNSSENTATKEIEKPENYIEDLDLSSTIQKGFNQRIMLVGHFEREDMSAEEKIAFAQETEQTIKPESITLVYNMQIDSQDGGEYNNVNLLVSNAYGSLEKMCEDTIQYFQTGDETYKTEFYEYSERALENLQKADQELGD